MFPVLSIQLGSLSVHVFGLILALGALLSLVLLYQSEKRMNIRQGSAPGLFICAGIIGFTKAVAREYAGKGITANALAPGYISTEMTDSLPEAARNALLQQVPAGRPGTPEDVAAAAAFLASGDASYINGQVIAVDGGMTMC